MCFSLNYRLLNRKHKLELLIALILMFADSLLILSLEVSGWVDVGYLSDLRLREHLSVYFLEKENPVVSVRPVGDAPLSGLDVLALSASDAVINLLRS